MGSGINNKMNEFLCNPKNVKKRRNTRLEKCYGHVNIATAVLKMDFRSLNGESGSHRIQMHLKQLA